MTGEFGLGDTKDPAEEGFVTQTILAGREDGVPGNCLQAVVASLFGMPLDAVPHFVLWGDWKRVMSDWLAEHGYLLTVQSAEGNAGLTAGRCIVKGMSPRDVMHVCVADGGRIVWDPHPSRAGLTSVDELWIIRPMELIAS